ncbi:MAG TPA: nicotinate-nucleotide--dimethylbenzimidazole phosphoribosyltransferase [Bacillota bacterium]|nr:nicotinate-nucleotide--dimethylbenzimidazole phosphoribosyltransferase [Clostridiaceae bacterium]HNT03398.1 nicotinate-nucleotide--dimethylbenzimidazole phosphoribosyltransferase [Bacillota bacterium]HPA54871.1 nicotinate-nucleotide--dimethylbenzimidazole phosphoribosyltransferase [Bacillota bacterium]HQO43130.1 nicotinate-nucleotide--dimethylbenzimidazole phosphoribosyltransferase [Bacillota bacterium]HQQ44373.1 nicotinate-nucleotide--dimethylbenzimidazole phosphoribosyltransferase [Bacillo
MEIFERTAAGIRPSYEESKKEAAERLDKLVKPIGSLGKLEDIAVKISGITGKQKNSFEKKVTIIMASDNGVAEEGVSAAPQAVTALMTINFLKGITGVCVLSKHAGADIRVVDIGVGSDLEYPGLINRKVRKGTSNMAKGPAMSKEEAISAIETGIEMVSQLVKEGYNLFGTGEMGIGNTSTASAVAMAFLGCSAEEAVGKGVGLTEEGYASKKSVIERAISINKPDPYDPIDVLSKVGGFDIAGMTGCFLGAAYCRVPIVIDGFISAAAALAAYRINPLVRDYIIPSHLSAEPGYSLVINEIGLEPLLDLNMRLGEGSGCPLAFNIIGAAEAIISDMATFEEATIKDDFLIDIRK